MSFQHATTFADEGASSNSPFSPPPPSELLTYHGRSSPKLVMLRGIDDMENWSSSVVLIFIQAKILSDLSALKLRCLPPHTAAVVAAEEVYWKRLVNLKVVAELKMLGVIQPLPFAPRQFNPPEEVKFALPDLSAATGTAKEKKELAAAAKEMFENASKQYEKQKAAIAISEKTFNAAAAKEHEATMLRYVKAKDEATVLLKDTLMNDARLAVWIQLLPSLGEAFKRIDETVPFSQPASLVQAIETAIFRDGSSEKSLLLLKFWQSNLANEGNGDPIQYHRFVLLTGRKLALLCNETVRDVDMRTVFLKGLPDDIFTPFKTSLHNHPSGAKTFEEVFQILKTFCKTCTYEQAGHQSHQFFT